jgi:hypothetical protein
MKKVLLTLCAGLFVSLMATASNSGLFTYDADQVNSEMAELQAIENYVSVNQGITLTNLQAENNALVNNMNFVTGEFGGMSTLSGEAAFGIPSFLWGCVFGVVGIAVVYFVTEDSEETKKAFFGCIVGSLSYFVFYVLWSLIWVGSFWY